MEGLQVKKENGFLTIKVFDVNSRKNNPTEIARLNPADSFLISYHHEGDPIHILLDTAKPGHGERVVIPYLLENGIQKLDYVFISHMHLDHFGGMIDILNDNRIRVDQLFYSPLPANVIKNSSEGQHAVWMELQQLIDDSKMNITEVTQKQIGQQIPIKDDLFFEIIATTNEKLLATNEAVDLNEFNLIVKLNFRNFTALFPGDCGERQATEILQSAQKDKIRSVSLLKAAHHGGDNSTTTEFIDHCNPKMVLIPCNEIVVDHRPSFIQKLHEFSRNGAKILRADRCHNLEMTTDGNQVTCQMETEIYKEQVYISL